MKQILLLLILCASAWLLPAQAQDTVISGRSKIKFISNTNQKDVSNAKTVKELPNLVILEPVFADANGNNMIDAGEHCSVRLKLQNNGKGEAQNAKLKVTVLSNVPGIEIEAIKGGVNLMPGSSAETTIGINGASGLQNGTLSLKIELLEANGFDAEPVEMKIETHQFETPDIRVADAIFSTDQGGKIKLNYPINLKILVQNTGKGIAEKIKAEFILQNENCLLLGDSTTFSIARLKSGETRELNFLFTANRRYTLSSIPVKVRLTESTGKYAHDTILSVGLTQNLTASNQVVVKGVKTDEVKVASLSSDVDKNIPELSDKNPNRYALVIGNEDYSSFQNNLNSEANVEFARNDARIFSEYCEKTLGVPKDNITLLTDAISSKMKSEIERFVKFAQYSGGNAELIFYYAGHGFPDETSKESYLMPVDISGANVKEGIKLSELYTKLSQYPTKHVTVFLDACFSGGGRNQGLLAARAVKIKPKENSVSGNLLVFAASSGDQISLPYRDKQHGMFTYYLLKRIQETQGNVTLGDLTSYVKQQVEINSVKVNYKDQNPVISVSAEMLNTWQNWKLK